MSEFSESYHLRSERSEDAIELLRRAGLKGYVFQPTSGWVTFLVEDGNFRPNQRIVANARQCLLHYMSAEDHGWGFTLFDDGKKVCAYTCQWGDPGMTVDVSKYCREVLLKLLPFADEILLDEFENEMRPSCYADIVGSEVSKTFARAMGLEHYDWIAYHYVERDRRFTPDRSPDVIAVS